MNILTAMAENQRIVVNQNDAKRKAVALAWLFHLVGDIHQPLHRAQHSEIPPDLRRSGGISINGSLEQSDLESTGLVHPVSHVIHLVV